VADLFGFKISQQQLIKKTCSFDYRFNLNAAAITQLLGFSFLFNFKVNF